MRPRSRVPGYGSAACAPVCQWFRCSSKQMYPTRMRASAVLAAVVIGIAGAASTIAEDVRGVLTRDLRFTSVELADLERGRVVRHVLDAHSAGEVGVVGAVRVSGAVDAFVAGVRRIEEFKRGPDVLQIARFSNPPQFADLDALAIDKDDFDLRRCRIGSCDIRL